MNICVAMQYFKKLTQYWFRALQENKRKKQREAKTCVEKYFFTLLERFENNIKQEDKF